MGELKTMNQKRIVCFRIDEHIDHQISRILGSRYSTRSRFIRNAIEKLLLQEENQVRLQAAQMTIQWG
jgi:Arc/MetJ-type ribon-helix-helix transcriptional regulator